MISQLTDALLTYAFLLFPNLFFVVY